MRSISAEWARERRREREQAMTPGERVALSLALGLRDAALYAAGQGITLQEARARLREMKRRRR